MQSKMQILIGSGDLEVWNQVTDILQCKGLGLTRFRTIKQACRLLCREDVLVVFCENQLINGTYEDLLTAAKEVRSRTRIVVAASQSNRFDSEMFPKAREFGAFDVLRESDGPKGVEWVVICAIRDEQAVRASAAWYGRG